MQPPYERYNEQMVESESDYDDVSGDDNSSRKKQKRRSKNDVNGRDHKCLYCDKTYLSYPALYTHMKNKHAKGPDGQPLISLNSGRGRGRPKKSSIGMSSLVEPTKIDYFRTMDKIGGPVEPTCGFNEVYTEIFIKKKTRKQLEEEQDELDESEEDDAKSENAFKHEFQETNQLPRKRERRISEEAEGQDDDVDEIENEEEVYARRDEY